MKLNPCSRCGGEAHGEYFTDQSVRKMYEVACKNKVVCYNSVVSKYRLRAIALWNTRPIEAALQEEIAGLKSLLQISEGRVAEMTEHFWKSKI